MARGKKRRLSPEEAELWSRVAQTATPLNYPPTQLTFEETPPKPVKREAPTPAERLPAFRIGERAGPVRTDAVNHLPSLSDKLARAPVRMDHGTHRQLMRGKLKPEGRIDLHGMTLSEAHPVLISFIFDAHATGKRLVLVITGKGKDRDSGGPIPIRRGILRHQVPGWLTAPPLGAMVMDIREAHQRHGGTGAYYVYLKRKR